MSRADRETSGSATPVKLPSDMTPTLSDTQDCCLQHTDFGLEESPFFLVEYLHRNGAYEGVSLTKNQTQNLTDSAYCRSVWANQ